ncbi:MAG TPA: site-specific integrase [Thermoanaerobaculia bacterium]|nr:site-specific integrase [Thermoanaerobaculia bacterium]
MTDANPDLGPAHAPKRTAFRLTLRQCKAARHGGTSYIGAQGKPVFRVEILWDTEVRGFGLRLLPSGRKSWVLRYRYRGRQHMNEFGDFGTFTLDKARAKARGYLARVENGEDPFSKREDGKTLASFEEAFAAACRARVEAREITASTAVKYAESFAALRGALGADLLDEIDGQTVRRAFAEISKERGRYAANRALSALSLILRLAVDSGYRSPTAPNPTADVVRNREVPRGLEFSDDELARLGAALDAEEERRPEASDTIASIRLLALTGARRREITSLTWGEVDIPGMRLRLRSAKTGPREIALNLAAASLLSALREVALSTEPLARVFPVTHHEAGYAIQYTWRRVRAAAELPLQARLHDLRHHYVTRGVAANFSEALVGKAVGHSSAATTRRYSHVSVEPTRALVEHVGGEIAAALAGKPRAEVVRIAGDAA